MASVSNSLRSNFVTLPARSKTKVKPYQLKSSFPIPVPETKLNLKRSTHAQFGSLPHSIASNFQSRIYKRENEIKHSTLSMWRKNERTRQLSANCKSDHHETEQATALLPRKQTNERGHLVPQNTPENPKTEAKLVEFEGASPVEHDASSWKEPSFFGVKLSPDTVAIASVYFVQGVLGLSRLAVSFFLKDELNLDPAETAILSGVSALPWLIKPLYGFISDGLPLFGYRRRSYLVLCGFIGALSWSLLASPLINDKYSAVALILLSSMAVAVSDVVVDSMVVERARGESQSVSGNLQSLCWGCSAIGGIVSAYFSGSLVQQYGTRFVFGVTATLPLITSAVSFLVQEKKVQNSPSINLVRQASESEEGRELVAMADGDSSQGNGSLGLVQSQDLPLVESIRSQMVYLWETIRQPSIFLPTLFIFLWQATPQSETAMFFFTTNKLGFDAEFLGRVRLVTSVASLAGVGIFNVFLKEVPLKKLFLWTTLIGTALGLTQLLLVTGLNRSLGISDQFFAMGDSLVLTVLGQVSFMPVLVLAARLCPPGVEATLFATLMSISNGAGVTSGVLGATLTGILGVTSTNFDNLPLLLTICNFSSLLPLPFLRLLPLESAEDQEEVDSVN